MLLLALDASTTACGWCIMDDGEYRHSGVTKPKHKGKWWERVADYHRWMYTWNSFSIDAVIYEVATGNKGNMHTNRLLGAVEYATRDAVNNMENCQFITVTASQVIASGCHKNALAVASAIAEREVTSGDEADAIGVALAGWKKIQEQRLMEVE